MNFLFAGCFSFLEPDAKLLPQNVIFCFKGFQTEFQGHAKQEGQMHLYSTITIKCMWNKYTKYIKYIIYIVYAHSIHDSRRHAFSKLKHSDKSTKDVTHGVFLAAPQKLVGSPLRFQLPGNETATTEVTPGYVMTPGGSAREGSIFPQHQARFLPDIKAMILLSLHCTASLPGLRVFSMMILQ